jgi:tripartite-type tricarboxylate transporter receptor subunit TctC
VVVDNRPGGGTILGTLAVVQAPPDGHTFGLAINSLTINPACAAARPDTLKDITPIAGRHDDRRAGGAPLAGCQQRPS